MPPNGQSQPALQDLTQDDTSGHVFTVLTCIHCKKKTGADRKTGQCIECGNLPTQALACALIPCPTCTSLLPATAILCPVCHSVFGSEVLDRQDLVFCQLKGMNKKAVERTCLHYQHQTWVSKVRPTAATIKKMLFRMVEKRESFGTTQHMEYCWRSYLACHGVEGAHFSPNEEASLRHTFHNVWQYYESDLKGQLRTHRENAVAMLKRCYPDLLDGKVITTRNISLSFPTTQIQERLTQGSPEEQFTWKQRLLTWLTDKRVLLMDTSTDVTVHVKRPRETVVPETGKMTGDELFL